MGRWLVVAVLWGAALSAQGRDGFEQRRALFADRFHAQFTAADKDESGTLGKEEARSLPFVMERFAGLDANEDGEVSWTELGSYAAQAKAARKAAMEQRQRAMQRRGEPADPEETTP